MRSTSACFCVAVVLDLLVLRVAAHMAMVWPPALRSKENPIAMKESPGQIDYSNKAPLPDAGNFPLRGYEQDMGKPAGGPVASLQAGAPANLSLTPDGAVHGGGR
jgi:hypothetical protein